MWRIAMLLAILVGALGVRMAYGQDVRIDVPVVLKEAEVVFNLDRPAFESDEPTGLQFLAEMVADFKQDGMKTRIVGIFHGNSGCRLLNDPSCDRVRNWHAGNPYKEQIAALMRAGVDVEECGHTMALKHWSNAELLPGVKVNTGANYRIIQLVQEGFVQLQP
jgi:intracellular sulfur oxidation DsrE/DsrF family protein